jgi:hypothetical protein
LIKIVFKGRMSNEADVEKAKEFLQGDKSEVVEYFDYTGDEFGIDATGTMYLSSAKFQELKAFADAEADFLANLPIH